MLVFIKRLTASLIITNLLITPVIADNKAVTITGAGASFPAPVYMKWASKYFQDTQNKINYQSIGSSAGIKQINNKIVDFGATDAPLNPDNLAKNDLFQFPTVIGGVVLTYNIKGIGSEALILDGAVLADIYLGKITRWNHEKIRALNPTLDLPDRSIAVIRRADGSGTSFVFTTYLAKVSNEWRERIGANSTVSWPTGIGGKGNDGVMAMVQRVSGAIGYVEYAYAKQNQMPYSRLISADGEVVSPSRASFSAAAIKADWQQSFAQDLTNQSGENAWPITATTFIVIHKKPDNINTTKEILRFFDWSYSQPGIDIVNALDYAPLPENVLQIIRNVWNKELIDQNGQPIYTNQSADKQGTSQPPIEGIN